MSITLNEKLFSRLNEIMAQARPNLILKRGNAFSVSEVTDAAEIAKTYSELSFRGLNVYGISGKKLSGEVFFKKADGKALEYEVTIEIHSQNPESWQVENYELNMVENEIFLKIS